MSFASRLRVTIPAVSVWPATFGVVLLAAGSIWTVLVGAPIRGAVVLLVTAAAVLVASRFPVPALGLLVSSALLQVLVDVQVNPAQALGGAALYWVGRRGSRLQHWLAVAAIAVFGVLQVVGMVRQGSELLELAVTAARAPVVLIVVAGAGVGIAVLLVPLMAGVVAQARTAALADESARERAERNLADARVLAAVEAERARLARDVHDMVGHALTVVITQSRVLAAIAPRDVDAAIRTAAAMEQVAGAALEEVRGVLAGAVHLADVTVDDLVALAGAAEGVQVSVVGEVPALAGEIGETAYRAMQELVTNALRHGDGDGDGDAANTTVVVRAGAGTIELEVRNATRPVLGRSVSSTAGSGLTGLHARLDGIGGTLTTEAQNGTWCALVAIPTGHRP